MANQPTAPAFPGQSPATLQYRPKQQTSAFRNAPTDAAPPSGAAPTTTPTQPSAGSPPTSPTTSPTTGSGTAPATSPTAQSTVTQPYQVPPAPTFGTSGAYGSTTPATPTTYKPGQGVNQVVYNNLNLENAQGTNLQNAALTAANEYSNEGQQFGNAAAGAYNALVAQPGYDPALAAQIDQNYGQYDALTPGMSSAIMGNPEQPVGVAQAGVQNEGQFLNSVEANIGGNLQNLQNGVEGNIPAYLTQQQGNLNNESGALGGALGTEAGSLNSAVNNPALRFDPNGTEKQLTNSDVQALTNEAATTAGNQFRSSEDAINRAAAAAGNESPLAIAAANSRLDTESAAAQGEAASVAEQNALQAQYQRAAGIEAQREGAVQTQGQMQSQAAESLGGLSANAALEQGAQAQNVANAEEQAQLQAATTAGEAGMQAAEYSGNAALNYGENATNTLYGAANTAQQVGSEQAANLANMQYQQGLGSAEATAAGAENVGQTALQGEQAYRQYLANEQLALEGMGQNSLSQANQAYGTEGDLLNQAFNSRLNEAQFNQANSFGNMLQNAVGTSLGNSLFHFTAEGGLFSEPTSAVVGERGPEMVSDSGGSKVFTHPTKMVLGENGPARVTPLNNYGANKLKTTSINPTGVRARYRHASGPQALSKHMPLKPLLPLHENFAFR